MPRADYGLQHIVEQNDLKAYQADPSGFLWAVLEVLRHTDAFAEPDFQALIERGRLAALGQQGMLAHAEDATYATAVDLVQRQQAYENSTAGVGPPRPVMPGEGSTPGIEMTEAQARADEARRQTAQLEAQYGPLSPTVVTGGTGEEEQEDATDVDEEGEGEEEAPLFGEPDEADDDEQDDADAEEDEEGQGDVEQPTHARVSTVPPGAYRKAAERGLEIRGVGTGWRVYDLQSGKLVPRARLEEPVPV